MNGLILHPIRLRAAFDGRLKVVRVPFRKQPFATSTLHHIDVIGNAVFTDGAVYRPPYAHGESRWVKETCYICRSTIDGSPLIYPPVIYYADGARKIPEYPFVRNAQSMPEWASRRTITLTNPRPERVQDVTEEEAAKEGIIQGDHGFYYGGQTEDHPDRCLSTARFAFGSLWNTIYPRYPWADNCWCWRYEVEVRR